MKKVAIVVKIDAKASRKADELEEWLKKRNINIIRKETPPLDRRISNIKKTFAPNDLFCVFVLGGDGTFLGAVRWIGNQDIPIIGIKFGKVGFMAEITEDNLFSAAESIFNKRYIIKPRMRLLIKVFKEKKEIITETVLNDIVINKGALARLAYIKTYIDNHYLTTYRADGLIVSTPTGSTAYSLAAGGPIIHPEVPGIIMTPICPFTLTNRPLIVPDSSKIKIRLEEKSSDIMLTFDGQAGFEINEKHTVVISRSRHPVNMISVPGQQYFDILKDKLRWSGGRV